MAKTGVKDLCEHLFARIEALGDEALEGDKLDAEIKRTDATVRVAAKIIDAGSLQLDAYKASGELGARQDAPPKLLGQGD